MSVERYDLEHKLYLGDSMEPREDGDWLRYSDHATALQPSEDT